MEKNQYLPSGTRTATIIPLHHRHALSCETVILPNTDVPIIVLIIIITIIIIIITIIIIPRLPLLKSE